MGRSRKEEGRAGKTLGGEGLGRSRKDWEGLGRIGKE